MEPLQTTMSITVLIGLIIATFALFTIVVMMGAVIYKENKCVDNGDVLDKKIIDFNK